MPNNQQAGFCLLVPVRWVERLFADFQPSTSPRFSTDPSDYPLNFPLKDVPA